MKLAGGIPWTVLLIGFLFPGHSQGSKLRDFIEGWMDGWNKSVATSLAYDAYYKSAMSKEFIENVQFLFPSIETLNYGEKCNLLLENEANRIRQELKPYFAKSHTKAFEVINSGGLLEDSESSPGLVLEDNNLRDRIESFINKFSETAGICQTRKSLFCSKKVGKCKCGIPGARKGLKFVHTFEGCQYDFGSGCIHLGLSYKLVNPGCVTGTRCLTGISKYDCSIANEALEFMQNSTLLEKLNSSKGFTCFCGKENP